jgi:hypothetical protein
MAQLAAGRIPVMNMNSAVSDLQKDRFGSRYRMADVFYFAPFKSHWEIFKRIFSSGLSSAFE